MTHRPIERGSLAQEDGWCNQVRKVLAVQDRELCGVPSWVSDQKSVISEQ